MRRLVGAVGSAVLLVTLGACGGGGDYCDVVEGITDDFADLEQMSEPDAGVFEDLASSFSDAADAAPDEVAAKWENLADAMRTMADAGGDPTSLDEEAMAQLEGMQTDADDIAEFTLEECDIDLDAS